MASIPRRFTVTETREAMEVRADNLEEVAAWCGGLVDVGRVVLVGAIGRDDDGGTLRFVTAGPGDVLVTDGSRWWDVPHEEFEREAATWTEEAT